MSKGSATGFGSGSASRMDPKSTAVITMDELQRIKQQCSMGNQLDQEQRTMDRLDLQQKSNARVANWPNTIEALRRKKDEDRIKRLEEEEIERRKIDAMEYELQVQARQQAIDRANKHMHDAQDQVKAFHTKMMMCDVIQERDVQMQLKKRKQEIERRVAQQWEELENQKLNEYDEKLRSKLMEEYNKKMKNAKFIKDQLLEYKMNCIKRFQEEQLEGELIRRQAEQELERERQKDQERRLRMIDQRDSLRKANDELVALAALEKKKDLEYEARIAEYAKKKEALEQLRRDKEEQKFAEKQQTRQRLIDHQVEHLKTIKNREDEILNKQVSEAEEKAMKLFEEQERRRLQMKDAIEKSRQQQINKRVAEKNQEKVEEQQFTEFWKIRNEELSIAEQQEKEEARFRHEELAGFLQRQKEVKVKAAEEEFKKELEAQSKAQALLDHNEKQFYSYAEQCIKDWQDNGKNVKPLILELKTYKKRIVS